MGIPLIFWDVDTQVDFMRADGKLYVPDSEAIIPALATLTHHAHRHGIPIVASADDHQPTDAELSAAPDFTTTFPPHCMHGTPGQAKLRETVLTDPLALASAPVPPAELEAAVRAHRGDYLLLKQRFDVFSNPNTLPLLRLLDPAHVVLYGVALDVCNKAAIDGLLAHYPSAQVTLVTDAVRAIRPEAGAELIEGWTRRGVRLATVAEVTASS